MKSCFGSIYFLGYCYGQYTLWKAGCYHEEMEAARVVYAHEFIKDMEDGTIPKYRNVDQSCPGQKQLISFARAFWPIQNSHT